MPCADDDHPPLAFDRHDVSGAGAHRHVGKREDHFPVPMTLRNRKGRRRIAHIDADSGLLGLNTPRGLQKGQGERAACRGIHNDIRLDGFNGSVRGLATNRGDFTVIAGEDFDGAAVVAQGHIVYLRQPSPSHEFDQRPAHAVAGPAKVAAWKMWLVAGDFLKPIEVQPHPNGTRLAEIKLEARKQRAERVQAAFQQSVRMIRLWCARARQRLMRNRVAFHHRHVFEVIRQHSRRCQAAHAGTDDNGISTKGARHQACPTQWPDEPASADGPAMSIGQLSQIGTIIAFKLALLVVGVDAGSMRRTTARFHGRGAGLRR